MELAELIELTSRPDVEACVRRCYYPGRDPDGAGAVSRHGDVYERLRELCPERDDDIMVAVDLEEHGQGIEYFDVHGVKPDSGDSVALDFQPWEVWLGMEIAPDTLQRYSPAEVVAHCIREMTFYGFEPDRIAEAGAEVLRRMEDQTKGKSEAIGLEEVRRHLELNRER